MNPKLRVVLWIIATFLIIEVPVISLALVVPLFAIFFGMFWGFVIGLGSAMLYHEKYSAY